jgi:hypothetical protein
MKKVYIILLAFVVMSCSKDVKLETPDFDVQVEKHTYKVGDTVKFNFSGRADNITFYSGRDGENYEFRKRTTVDGVIPKLSFTSLYGSGRQYDNLRVMVCTNLKEFTKEAVISEETNWEDISERATWHTAPGQTVSSGNIDLSDLLEEGKPLFIAFKHVGYTDPVYQVGTRLIQQFNVTAQLPDGTSSVVTTLLTAGWSLFDVKNSARNWALNLTGAAPDIRLIGGSVNEPEIEDWAITKPLFFNKVTPDIGKPIQYISGNVLSHYNFLGYNKPGTYNVVFVASNANVDGQKTVVRQLEITIEP